MICYDDYSYSKNCAIGRTYLNRFLIEEENQSECYGVFGENFVRFPYHFKKTMEKMVNDQSDSILSHFIIAAELQKSQLHCLSHIFKSIPNLNLMITRVESQRLTCVQKEEYKKFYKEGDQIRYGPTFIEAKKSVGDEIEEMYHDIKMKAVLPDYQKIYLNFDRLYQRVPLESRVTTFHLSMLSYDEEIRMTKFLSDKTVSFGVPAYIKRLFNIKGFFYQTRLSPNEQNFALSICFRISMIRLGGRFYELCWQSDWQKEIMQNFEEFQEKSRKRKNHEISQSCMIDSDESYDDEYSESE